MNPYNAYRRQQDTGWTRIDLLLTLYDGAIERLDKALAFLRQGNMASAKTHLANVQLLVTQLAAGVNCDIGGETSVNLLRLYEFSIHTLLNAKDIAEIEAVRRVLDTLREGFRSIRDEALRLERSGAIPPVDGTRLVEVMG